MNENRHLFYMEKALLQAKVAFKKNEVPVGAVVVSSEGKILGRGHNQIEKKKCQAAHAEILAIQSACKKTGDWRLDGCWLYVTLEPCLMCLGLIQLSRFKGVVFGTTSDVFGFGFKKKDSVRLYKKDLIIKAGLKEMQCADILKRFFKEIRMKGKVEK
jgi:tRNA(adenine34) deaminase